MFCFPVVLLSFVGCVGFVEFCWLYVFSDLCIRKPSKRYISERLLSICQNMPLRKTHTASSWFHGESSALAALMANASALPALMNKEPSPIEDSQGSVASEIGPVLPIPGVVGVPASPAKAETPAAVGAKPVAAIKEITKDDCLPEGDKKEHDTSLDKEVKTIVPGEKLARKIEKQENKKGKPSPSCLEVLEKLKAQMDEKKKGKNKPDKDVKAVVPKKKSKAKAKTKPEKEDAGLKESKMKEKENAVLKEDKKKEKEDCGLKGNQKKLKGKRAVEADPPASGSDDKQMDLDSLHKQVDTKKPAKPKSQKKPKVQDPQAAQPPQPGNDNDIRDTDTKKTFTSRQYHKQRVRSKAEGKSADEAKLLAQEAHREAAKLWDKLH